MKNIYLIVAPSGAGKTTITELLGTKYGFKSIQSYTTRPPRFEGETGHIFISNEDLDKLTDIVAFTEFAGNRYCATAQQVEENDLYVIDPKGVEYFKESYKGSKQIKIVYIESDLTTRYERMKKRAEDNGSAYSEAVDHSLKRITNDVSEFYDYRHHTAQVDYILQNGADTDINTAVNDLYSYIISCEQPSEDKQQEVRV